MKLELEWYWNYSDADCGLKSNWAAMVQAAVSPGSSYQDPYDSFRLRAIDKRRTIEKVLFALPTVSQNVLFTLFGPCQIPHAVLTVLGKDLAGPALCLTTVKVRDLLKTCDRQLLNKATPKDKLLLSEVRIDAANLKQASFNDWSKEYKCEK